VLLTVSSLCPGALDLLHCLYGCVCVCIRGGGGGGQGVVAWVRRCYVPRPLYYGCVWRGGLGGGRVMRERERERERERGRERERERE
jgi:hypothetical protein